MLDTSCGMLVTVVLILHGRGSGERWEVKCQMCSDRFCVHENIVTKTVVAGGKHRVDEAGHISEIANTLPHNADNSSADNGCDWSDEMHIRRRRLSCKKKNYIQYEQAKICSSTLPLYSENECNTS